LLGTRSRLAPSPPGLAGRSRGRSAPTRFPPRAAHGDGRR
jgi:hypothetical protein